MRPNSPSRRRFYEARMHPRGCRRWRAQARIDQRLGLKAALAVPAGSAQLYWWTLPNHQADAQQRSRWVWTQVRALLAAHAGLAPGDLLITRSANGKPQAPQLALAFSLSHDDSVAVLALAAVGLIGVDVLSDRAFANAPRLARRLLSAPELAQWQAANGAMQLQQLRDRFCATEAVVKALDWRLWPALGGIHFLRQGRIARIPIKRAQLFMLDGRRAQCSFALASDAQIDQVVHIEPAVVAAR